MRAASRAYVERAWAFLAVAALAVGISECRADSYWPASQQLQEMVREANDRAEEDADRLNDYTIDERRHNELLDSLNDLTHDSGSDQ